MPAPDILDWTRDWIAAWTPTPWQADVLRGLGGGELRGRVWGDVGDGPRRVVACRIGRRGGKSGLCSIYALWRALTCNLDDAAGGAKVVIPIVAPTEKATRIVLDMCIHMATKGPLADCVNTLTPEGARKRQAITEGSMHLVRPHDGHEVEIRACVAAAGGKNLVGYHLPCVIIDEAERLRSDSESKVTDEEQLDAAMPAILPGGAAVMISTPFDLDSYMNKHVERNYGHPVDGIACVGRTLEMRDSPTIAEMVAAEHARNPRLAMRDFDCVPMGRPDAYFARADVDACTIMSAATTRSMVSGASDLAFVNDGCAQAIIERQGDMLVQVFEDFVEPTPDAPLVPSAIRAKQRDTYVAHGCHICAADVHEYSSLCETLIPAGVQVAHAPASQTLTTAFAYARDLVRAGKLAILPATAQQMMRVKTKSDGSPSIPRHPGEGHCDLVSALVAAVWLDRRHGPLSADPSTRQAPTAFRGAWTV